MLSRAGLEPTAHFLLSGAYGLSFHPTQATGVAPAHSHPLLGRALYSTLEYACIKRIL